MNRRGFLGSIIAVASAPAIVRASSLMPGKVWTPQTFKATERFGRSYVDPAFFEDGFGMAPLKQEGSMVLFDRERMLRELLPGLNAVFSAEYDKYELKGLK